MNTPVVQNNQLPVHLQHLASDPRFAAFNQSAAAGITAGGHPHLSIKGSRFRLQSPQNEEIVVNELFLDVVIVDANPNGLSKTYYKQDYDAKSDDGSFKAPDCFSDNGVAPSSKAAQPQCGTCVACPHNVWGSKVMSNGSVTRACSDSKKVAILVANNPEGPVFELRVPPASLKNWAAYVESLSKRSIPAFSVVTRLSFDTNSDFPKITFTASGWATAEHAAAIGEVIGTEEVNQCTGKNDKPFQGNVAAIAAPLPPRAALPPVVQPIAQQNAQAQAQSAFDNSGVVDQGAAEKPKRTRRTKEQMATTASPAVPQPADMFAQPATQSQRSAFTPAPQAPMGNEPLPPILQNRAPAHGAVLNPPTVTDAALDALIASAMQA